MSRLSKIVICAVTVISLFVTQVFAASDLAYDGYNYNAYGESVSSPEGYEPSFTINGESLGCGSLNSPQDIFAAENGDIYIADTGNSRIVVLDNNYSLKRVMNTIEIDGKSEPITSVTGLFVNNDYIYIVQSDLQRVLRCDMNGKVMSQFLRPVSDIFGSDMVFTPTKVLVNNYGTVYILVKNFVYGALTYSPDGNFLNFYGSNRVQVTLELLLNYFWKQILNREQITQMKRYVPVEYSNFCIDSENFIFTVTKGVNVNQVRRLNTLGENVLTAYERNISSNTGNYGDIETGKFNGVRTSNAFVDVAVNQDGFINILDQNNGRVFQFDSESRLLHIFGGESDSGYGFKNAVALETIGDDVVVLDAAKNRFTVFSQTEYGSLIKEAIMLYNEGFYGQAKELWQKIVIRNQNFELAYDGLAKAAFEEENYKEAMNYYKLAYSREGYSKAFKEYRAEILRNILPYIASGIVILFFAFVIIKKKKMISLSLKSRTLNILFHPSDELFAMKYYNNFSSKIIFAVLSFMFISLMFTYSVTAFTFNYNNLNKINMLVVLAAMLYIFIAFCAVNWCITSLLDGKGKIKEIACSVCYCLIPYIASSFIRVFLSYFLTVDEEMFLSVITAIGLIWSGILLISALKTIHDYSFGKAIISILLTVFGVLILIFICVLLVGLLQQILSFFVTIYNELMYR